MLGRKCWQDRGGKTRMMKDKASLSRSLSAILKTNCYQSENLFPPPFYMLFLLVSMGVSKRVVKKKISRWRRHLSDQTLATVFRPIG